MFPKKKIVHDINIAEEEYTINDSEEDENLALNFLLEILDED